MEPKEIKVSVSRTEDNYCCGWNDGRGGAVFVTAATLDQLKKDFAESLQFHIEGCEIDGDEIADYLRSGDYTITYDLDAAALIRSAESYTTMSAISRASGINQKQLSHYATGVKRARPRQIARIKDALRIIGEAILALS